MIEYLQAKVSIIIPCYNHGHFLGDAIQSALGQTYPNKEVIVVDDGSTDETSSVVANFDNAVHYIYQENRGLSAARNTGIEEANGEYVAFLDADDLWHSNFIIYLLPVLIGDIELGAVYCGSQFIDVSGRLLPQKQTKVVTPRELFRELAGGNFFMPHCWLIRRVCLDKVGGFDTKLRSCEDFDMWLRISRQFRVAGIPEVLAYSRVVPGSMSSHAARMFENHLAVVDKHFGDWNGDPSSWGMAKRRAYAGVYLRHAFTLMQADDISSAADYLKRAIAINPSLVKDEDICFEILCSIQPRGYQGDFETLDLERSADAILQLLDLVFARKSDGRMQDAQSRLACASASFAQGLASYGQRQLGQTRKYLLAAATLNPCLLFNLRFVQTLAKSCLGIRLHTLLRSRIRPEIDDTSCVF